MAKLLLLSIGIVCSITLLFGCADKEQNEENYTVDPKISFALKERINNVIGTKPKQIIVNNEEVDLVLVDWDLNLDKVNNLLSNAEIIDTDKADETLNNDKAILIVYENIQFIILDVENDKFYAVSEDVIVELKGKNEDIKGIQDWLYK